MSTTEGPVGEDRTDPPPRAVPPAHGAGGTQWGQEPSPQQPPAGTTAPGLFVAQSGIGSQARHAREAPPSTGDPTQEAAPPDTAFGVAVGRSGVDGVPGEYNDGVAWLRNGLRRHRVGVGIGLLVGWTGVWLAAWGAVIGAIVGVFVSLGVVDQSFGPLIHAGAGQAVSTLGIVGGLFFGALSGLLVTLFVVLAATPYQAVVAIISGAFVAILIVLVCAAFERLGLQLRGYRRLSRDEVRRVAPLIRHVAEAMDLEGLPRFAMADVVTPNAWTHMRTIVITSGLLQTLDDAELRAVLAHELKHWQTGDSVGLTMIWAAAWPIALTYNFGMLLTGRREGQSGSQPKGWSSVLFLIGWFIAWPAWVILKVLVPIIAIGQRRYEYEADAAASDLGYASSLITALRKMGAFESGRTGWERAMAATHPPTELRVEALQAPKPDDEQYQESELRGPTLAELGRLLRALVPGQQKPR